jgi:hypothetical protein
MIRRCAYCNKSFKASSIRKGKWTKFCSQRCYGETLKGHIPWNKGLHWSGELRNCQECGKDFYINNGELNKGRGAGKYCSNECKNSNKEWRELQRTIHEGRKYTPEQIKQASLRHGGNGIPKKRPRPESVTLEYKKWRKSIFERDGYRCQVCERVGNYLEAHHIKSWAKHKELRYKIENGVTLCRECHKLEHRKK